MNKLPFSVYDTFAYLAAGLIVAVAADYAFDIGLRKGDRSIVDALFGIIVLYIAGHLIAHLSSSFFEDVVVRRWLGPPEERLLKEARRRPAARVFRAYFRPLPASTRDHLRARAQVHSVPPEGRGFYFHCYGGAHRDPVTRERLASFLNLYGFCRNASLALLLSAVILIVGAVFVPGGVFATVAAVHRLWFALAAFAGAWGLFLRYLKFFRHFTAEVFLSYATLSGSDKA